MKMPSGSILLARGVLLALVGIAGCPCGGPKPPPRPTPFTVCAEADERLNWYDDRPHTLFVRVFQLSRLDGFQRADLETLLTRRPDIDGAEGAPSDRTLAPGETAEIEVLRRETAHFLGIVGGYYSPEGDVSLTRAFGDLRSDRPCEDIDDDEENWVHFGANGIERPAEDDD
jgi:type VI secretion system VasD/TssJ family lipoprotein